MGELYCRVETPKGSAFGVATAVRRAVVSPVDCCYFPDTLARGGGSLEAIVCVSVPGDPGGRMTVKPVALLRTGDRHGPHQHVLCVSRDDPSFSGVEGVRDLPARLRAEIERFITSRSSPENPMEIVAWCSADDAMAAIDDAAAYWAASVDGHG